MTEKLVVYKVENAEDLRGIASLQDLYDPQFFRNTNSNVNSQSALEIIINFYKQGHDFWIARVGEEMVGYAQGSSLDGFNYDSLVYVKPGFRNKGIDRILMLEQIDFARENDFAREKKYAEMWLNVLADEASMTSLSNMGFVVMASDASRIHSFFLLNSVNLLRAPHH